MERLLLVAFLVCLWLAHVHSFNFGFTQSIPRFKRYRADIRSHCNDDGSEDLSALSSSAPFLEALLTSYPKVVHRYFFPAHSGGKYAPQILLRALAESQDTEYATKNLPVFELDLPELDETDNLHSPEGPLLHSMMLAARLFKSRRTWYLINGRYPQPVVKFLKRKS